MAGPVRGEIRQIALSGLATSKWIKLRSAIDSSHALPSPFDRSHRRIDRTISLFLTAESLVSLLLRYFCFRCYIMIVEDHNRRREFFFLFSFD